MRWGEATLAAAFLGLALTLGGCRTDDPPTRAASSPATPAEGHNDADIAFATEMIQHHAQALVMVDLARERDLDPAVAALAEDIQAAQVPEIETMVDWLREWDQEVPETVRDHVNSDHSGHGAGRDTGMDSGMPGMLNEADMAALEEASDAEFQDRWLESMITHHEGAVEMAQAQQAEGEYEPAIDLAAEIEESQTREIDAMRALLSE